MRKTLLTTILALALLGMAGGMALAVGLGEDCTTATCDAGLICDAATKKCVAAAAPAGLAKGAPECIKMGVDVTLEDVQTGPESGGVIPVKDIKFEKGAVVAMRAMTTAGECRFLAGTIKSECKKDTITKTDACYIYTGKEFGILALLNTLYSITNWAFTLLMIVAVLMIVFGGFTYITAAGDPEKAGKGKQILTLSAIGIALAVVAKAIPSVIKFIMGLH